MAWIVVFICLAILFGALGFGLVVAALKVLFYIVLALLIIAIVARAVRRV